MGLSPRVTDTPSLLITEVSLTLCICHRLPQGATLILTHPRYRSLLLGGHGAVGVNLARYFNADTRNVPSGLFIQLSMSGEGNLNLPEEGRIKNPFTTTGH